MARALPDTYPPRTVRAILAKLETQHPDANTELHFRSPFELLVATILSAQSTDQRVNMVTPALFARFPDAPALAAAEPSAIEPIILQTGFFRQKSKAIVGVARALVERFGGNVPASMDELISLPGVGRKTANVVLGHALGVPGLPVDRHVLRVSNRLGIAASDDPEVVEQQLMAALPREAWTRASDTLILHGRRICRPRPLCDQCAARDDCRYYRAVIEPAMSRAIVAKAAKARTAASRPGTLRPPGISTRAARARTRNRR
jgi:endonuclease III